MFVALKPTGEQPQSRESSPESLTKLRIILEHQNPAPLLPWRRGVGVRVREAPWSAAAKLPPCNSGRTAAATLTYSTSLCEFSCFQGACQPMGMRDCPENDCAVGGADIAFYVGATGRIPTRQCRRHPNPFSWFLGAASGLSDCSESQGCRSSYPLIVRVARLTVTVSSGVLVVPPSDCG